MGSDKLRMLGLLFGILGVGLLCAALFFYRGERSFQDHALRAQGTVVDQKSTLASDRKLLYRPVIEFSDAQGQRHRVTGRSASNPPAFRRGDAVTVLYNKDAPDEAKPEGFFESWLLPSIFAVVGLLLSLAGGILSVIGRRAPLRP